MKDNDYLKMLVEKRNGKTEPEKNDLPGPINQQGLKIDPSPIIEKWEKDINHWQMKARCSTGPEKYTAHGFIGAIKDCMADLKQGMKQ